MQRLLDGRRGIARPGEHGKPAIPFPSWAHDDTLVLRDQRLDEGVMPGQRRAHLVGVVLPQAAGALHIREQEGDRARGQH
jgi:hypothetical protein